MEEKERYIIDRFDEDIFDIKKEYYPSNQTICDTLNQQYKRIKELEEELDDAKRDYIPKLEFGLQRANKMGRDAEKENQQLKQQLYDLPKKIVEEITNELSNNTSLYFEMRESTSAHCPNKEYEWFNYVRFRNYINTILEKFGGEDE